MSKENQTIKRSAPVAKAHMANAARFSFRMLMLSLFALLIVIALLTAVLRLGTPYVSSYKDEIQAWASDYLRTPVEIGSMEFDWGATSPRITLTDVALLDQSDGGKPIKLRQMLLDLNLFKTIFADGWHINEVTLVGVDLSLEYTGKQQFKITGYEFKVGDRNTTAANPAASDVSAASTPDSDSDDGNNLQVMSWLMNANRVGLTDSRIKLLDRTRGIDYEIAGINISAENSSDLHRLRLELQLPGQLGRQLEIDIDLNGKANELGDARGKFYVSGNQINLQNWMQLWPRRTLDVNGQSDFQLWGSWQGNQLHQVRGQFASPELKLDRAGSVENVQAQTTLLSEFDTDVNWQRGQDGWLAQIDSLKFNHLGQVNDFSNTRLQVSDVDGQGRDWKLDSSGQQLNMGLLSGLALTLQDILPLNDLPQALQAMQPTGVLSDWHLSINQGLGASGTRGDSSVMPPAVDAARLPPPIISLQGQLLGFEAQRYAIWPSVKGLDASFNIDGNRGTIELDATKLEVHHPDIFPQTLRLDEVSAGLDVKWTEREFSVASSDVSVLDQGLTATSSFRLQKLPLQSARLDAQGEFELPRLSAVTDYMGQGRMREPLVKWFKRALKSGSVTNGQFLMAGELQDFPFAGEDGLLQASMDLNDATLEFRTDWPEVSAIDGKVTLSGSSFTANASSAEFDGVAIERGRVRIDNLFKPVAVVTASATDTLQSLIDSANQGPMSYLLAPAFAGSRATGKSTLDIAVVSPLRDKEWRDKGEKFSMAGRLELANNNLVSDRFGVELENLGGVVNFDDNGFDIAGLDAQFLGKPVLIEGHSSGRGAKRISELNVSGKASASTLMTQYGIPMQGFFDGVSRWNVNVEIPHVVKAGTGVRVTASTDLAGTRVSLPAPLAKSAASSKRLLVSSVFASSGPEAAERWTVRYGSKAIARIGMEPDYSAMRSMRLQLGGGELEPSADSPGIRINGVASKLEFDSWVAAVDEIIDQLPSSSGQEPLPLVSARLDVDQFVLGSTSEGRAMLRINTDGQYINGTIDNQYLRGNIRIPRAHWDKSEPVLARIAYAEKKLIDDLADADADDAGESTPLDPRSFPRLNIHLARFKWDKLLLSDVRFRSEPSPSGMRVTTLGFANEHAQMTGDGYWRWKDPQNVNPAFAGQQLSHLDLQLQSDDIGKTVSALGFSDALASGRGSVEVSLDWQRPLYSPELREMQGEINLALRKGRILKVEPGAARIFGLFALQSIPRRLTLDFSDIVMDGLDYNRIKGKVDIADGKAVSKLVQLEGPVGVIDVTGSTDFIDQTYDQRITVLPRISGALPLIGVISGGATAGIGALIAGPLLKALGIDIDKIGLSEHSVTGSWEEPVIQSLK